MKIHIVQKGDTLWKIAQKYGVDFNELKAVNTQLSNPDMIMPGMKIKIPTGSVPVVKKENPMMPQMPISKEMPIVKEMPIAKEMPLPAPIPMAPKEMPIVKEAPIPIEQPEIDYNIEQKMYNYTFNLPTFPTIPYMPIKEAAPKKVKEEPVKEMPAPCPEPEAIEIPPTMPAQPMPCPPCVPVTGYLPGSGLPCGYDPVPIGYAPNQWAAMPGMAGMPYAPQGTVVNPAMYDNDGLDAVSAQMYPGLSGMSAPVAQMPTTAGGDCGCGGPTMASPAGYGGMPVGFGGYPTDPQGGYAGIPVGGYTGMQTDPQAAYGMPTGFPSGYSGMPMGVPTGYGGMPMGMPTGYGGMPMGYGSAPMGMPAGIGGMSSGGHDGIVMGMPSGLEGMPTGFPAGYGGMPGYPGAFAQPSYPPGQFQVPMPASNLGATPLRNDDLEDDEDSQW